MTTSEFELLRIKVQRAREIEPDTGDADLDALASSSLAMAFNRMAPRDLALPTAGVVALEVSVHSGGRLDAFHHSKLEGSVARAIAFVGAAIAHPDADVNRLRERALRQSIVYSRPTSTGAIAFLPERTPVLPGFDGETVAERAMTRLASILPSGPDDHDAAGRLLGLRQPERRAVGEMASLARDMSGVSLLLLGRDDVLHSTVTSSQADDIDDFFRDVQTQVITLPPVYGRLDGMRFSRQMYFLQTEQGQDRQGVIDVDLVGQAKELLDQRVKATLERVQVVHGDGKRSRPAYRLVAVEPAPPGESLI